MKKTLLLIATFICSSAANAEQETTQQKDLRLLLEFITGEFNNYNQINFQNNGFLESSPVTDYSRLHHTRERINAPGLEGNWIYSQINRLDRDGDIYRQSYSEFFIDSDGQITSRAYKLVTDQGKKKTEKKAKRYPSKEFLNPLTRDQFKQSFSEGCDTKWRREIDQFIGVTDFNTCMIDSKYKDEKRLIFSEDIIARTGFWGREGAYTQDGKLSFGLEAPNYYRYQRVRPMKCWASIHLGDDQWEFYNNLNTHDVGGSLIFGKEKQYRLQLKQTVFPATDWNNAFELFMYRQDEEKAFAYAWTEPTAKHIAVNMREVQASCKLAE